jgi:hypothetical protein
MPRTPSVLVLHKLLPHHRHQVEPITRLLAERGVQVATMHLRDVVPYLDGKKLTALTAAGHPLEKYDAVYFFGVTSGGDLYRLRAVKASGIRVINDPDAIHHTANKHLCSVALAAAGVPVPPHLLLSGNKETKQAAVRKLGPRMILKPTNGSLGRTSLSSKTLACWSVSARKTTRWRKSTFLTPHRATCACLSLAGG